jgi:membrane protease YdiL (CAAX protease family)
MVAGPSVTGLVLTGIIDGKAGLRELRSRLLKWRVDTHWYAVALLASPLLATAVTLLLSPLSPEFLPGVSLSNDKTALVLLGLVVGVTVGFFEELGWTGFAVPRLNGVTGSWPRDSSWACCGVHGTSLSWPGALAIAPAQSLLGCS